MKKKDSNYKGHLIYEYDAWAILSFVVITICIVCSGIATRGFHVDDIITDLSLSFVVFLLFEFFAIYYKWKKTIRNYPRIDSQINSLIDHIKHKIEHNNNHGELEIDLNNLSNSIKVAVDTNGIPIKFDPDSDATNKLFTVNNLIAISEAEPYKWLDPTYIFYMINNAVLNLNWTKDNTNKKTPINFASDKSDSNDKVGLAKYESFILKRKNFIEVLSKITPNDTDSLNQIFNSLDRTVRFVFLSDEDLELSKCTIEYLYTIHEMFGCFFYIINIDTYKDHFKVKNNNIIEERNLSAVIKSTNYDTIANNNKVDIGFGINGNRQFEVFQRSKQILESTLLNDIVKINLANYLKTLAGFLLINYDNERVLYNNCFIKGNSNLIPNTKNYFIYFND